MYAMWTSPYACSTIYSALVRIIFLKQTKRVLFYVSKINSRSNSSIKQSTTSTVIYVIACIHLFGSAMRRYGSRQISSMNRTQETFSSVCSGTNGLK